MSKVTALYHIVFCTKERENTLPLDLHEELYRFIWHQIRLLNCKLIRIGGVQNHIHMLVDLHPSVSLSALMQNVKGRSSGWMGSNPSFSRFRGWAAEYYGCSVSPENRQAVLEYISNQIVHHKAMDVERELLTMAEKGCFRYDSRDLI